MAQIGVLLIQLGTPDEPTASSVREYLREFLSDPRVIEAPRWQWWFVLRFLILPRRSKDSAAKYARIWDPRTGSPLLHFTHLQTEAVAGALPREFTVRFGMRYGRPSIERAVSDLIRDDVDRLLVLPMYPQYAAASTATACDCLFDALRKERLVPALRVVPPFYDHPAYIQAQAAIIRESTARLESPPEKYVFSFHGYPVDFVTKGDPYQIQVEATARLLARELGLADNEWLLTYQSRFGNQIWLQPFTDETLCRLAREGVRRVLLASPGFTTDCLETIDEIGEAADAFLEAGGEQLIRCPCLNNHPLWIDAMKQIVLQESLGWHPSERGSDTALHRFAARQSDDSTILEFDRNEVRKSPQS